MTKLRRKLLVIAEVLREYIRVRKRYWRQAQSDLRTALVALRDSPDSIGRAHVLDPAAEGRTLGYAVNRIGALMPGESRCLMRSLVLTSLLSRRGIPSTLVIGVRPGTAFAAHAWVEYQGEPLLPPQQYRFERLVEL